VDFAFCNYSLALADASLHPVPVPTLTPPFPAILCRYRRRRTPWFLYLITAALVVVFVVEIAFAGWQFASTSVNPLLGPDSRTLVLMGAKVRCRASGRFL